ncbi:hypothetical protein BGX26_000876 [Mortierella sp. AD094]|nr:hypothetical protein BGX26_000876 [Mortierella sp. AD094]
MTNETASDHVKQAFQARYASDTFHIQTKLDKITGQRFVLWRDILKLFSNAKWVFNGSEMVTYMTGDDYEDLIPERIEYHPDITLEVVVEDTANSTNTAFEDISTSGNICVSSSQEFGLEIDSLRIGEATNDVAHQLLAGEISGTKSSQSQEDILVTSNHTDDLFNCENHPTDNSLVVYSATTIHNSRMSLESFNQLHQSYLQANKNNQAELATWLAANMTQQFDELKIEMHKNSVLQQQMNQMQLRNEKIQKKYNDEQQQMIRDLESKQQEVISLNRQMAEKQLEVQQEIREMKKQTLDRLAIIQNHVQSLLTQTFELHEYPIPRLFIILPKPSRRRDAFGKLFSSQFKLFFLCECGDHTKSRLEESTISHEIHLAKHEGYDITKPNEFFEKYGSYILTVMHIFKYGIMAAGVVVPSLEKFKILEGMDTIQEYLKLANTTMGVLVDDAISFLEGQQNDPANGIDATGQARFKELEVLEGAELRQLQSYLSVKDEGRVLGKLYRIVTAEGHVKWVCNDHYRDNYRQKTIQYLREIVVVNGGTFTEYIGKIVIHISSTTRAKQFYDALIKAHGIQELEIGLDWDVTMDDLRKFANAISKANINHLTISRFEWGGPPLDFVNSGRRYSPLIQLVSNERIQSLSLHNFDEFFRRVGSSWTTSQQLRVLRIHEDIKIENGVSKSHISKILHNYPGLTELGLNTLQPKSLIEFIIGELGHLQATKASNLRIQGNTENTETMLKIGFQRSADLSAKKTRAFNSDASTARSKGAPNDLPTNLNIEIFCYNHQDFMEDLAFLYSKYDWSIEHLDVQGLEFLAQHPIAEFFDKLTESRAPKCTSMTGLRASCLTADNFQKIERVVQRSQAIKSLRVRFDDREVETIQEKVKYLHGPIGKKLTEIEFDKYSFPDSYFPDASKASYLLDLSIKNPFPMLESFKFFTRLVISEDWAEYIAAIVARPSQAPERILDTAAIPQNVSTVEPSLKSHRPIKEFRLAHSYLGRESWRTIIRALDFTTINILGFQACSFSLEQLEMLTEIILEEASGSVVSLQELHLFQTKLRETDDDIVQELFVRLREKTPQVEIFYEK